MTQGEEAEDGDGHQDEREDRQERRECDGAGEVAASEVVEAALGRRRDSEPSPPRLQGVPPALHAFEHHRGCTPKAVPSTGVGPPSMDLDQIDKRRIPVHIACVMDGNGRWATKRGLPRTEGHAAGEEALFDTVEGALELGVKWLTVYAFSTENWRRPPDEVRYLMKFNESILSRRRDELHERGVRITFAGRRDWRVPKSVLRQMDEAAELTKRNKRLTLTIAF